MDIMTHAKFHFNRLMLTLIFGVWPLSSLLAWQTTEKAGPDRVKDIPPFYQDVITQWASLSRYPVENVYSILAQSMGEKLSPKSQ